jgi:protein associated with RNAse G/E
LEHNNTAPMITVTTTKYDGALHALSTYRVIESADWGWLLYFPAGQSYQSYRGERVSQYQTLRWIWRDTWWDANLAFTPNGDWALWYCNILSPVTTLDGNLYAQDLDLDVIWDRNRGIYVDDADELEQHSLAMSYPPDLVRRIWSAAYDVEAKMRSGAFPFTEHPESLRIDSILERA